MSQFPGRLNDLVPKHLAAGLRHHLRWVRDSIEDHGRRQRWLDRLGWRLLRCARSLWGMDLRRQLRAGMAAERRGGGRWFSTLRPRWALGKYRIRLVFRERLELGMGSVSLRAVVPRS